MVSGQDLAATPVHRGVAVDDSVGGEWRGPLDLLREELIAWAVDRFGVDSITEAKEEFFLKTGKVFHDDESYHRRMSYFLDYFLFDRPISRNLEATNQTPFELHQSHHRQEKLRSFTHSLFKVNRVLANGLLLKNLCNDEKLKISKQSVELFDGIVKGDIFQGFIFQLEDDLVLSHGLIFHPARSHRILIKSIKEAKKLEIFDQSTYLFRSALLQLKHARLKHVDPRLVYTDTRGL